MERTYAEVDVFTTGPLSGNPLAVVHCPHDPPDDATMQAFASWTDFSETTFLLPPTEAGRAGGADYRVRIFTPTRELPFAGHPTLGTAHAWLEAGGLPRAHGRVVQECGAGLVDVRRGEMLAFAAPGFARFGPVDDDALDRASRALRVDPARVVAAHWLDNGPGWLGLQLASADDVLTLEPGHAAMGDQRLGVIGLHRPGSPADAEVRAFTHRTEDPVTGSLNAGFAVWLVGTGVLPAAYTARQGTALGRDGRVHVVTESAAGSAGETRTWIGGDTRTVVLGSVAL